MSEHGTGNLAGHKGGYGYSVVTEDEFWWCAVDCPHPRHGDRSAEAGADYVTDADGFIEVNPTPSPLAIVVPFPAREDGRSATS